MLILSSPAASGIAVIAHVVLWAEFKGTQRQRDIITAGFSLAVCAVLTVASVVYATGLWVPFAGLLWWVFRDPPGKEDVKTPATKTAVHSEPVIVDVEFWDETDGRWCSQSTKLVKRS